jgi:hypothetical protein
VEAVPLLHGAITLDAELLQVRLNITAEINFASGLLRERWA